MKQWSIGKCGWWNREKKRQTFRVRSYIAHDMPECCRVIWVNPSGMGSGLGCHVGASSSLYILRIADVLFHLSRMCAVGIAKAMKHNTWFDNGSSVFIFMGYAVPGYVLGA